MSGYGSLADAKRVVRDTIELNISQGLPRDLAAYNMAGVYRDVIASRGVHHGYSIEPDEARFWDAVRKNLRVPILAPDAPTEAGTLVRLRDGREGWGITTGPIDTKHRIPVMWRYAQYPVFEDPTELVAVSL